MNELKVFEGNKVEVIEVDGRILFNPYHVGRCLDIGESAVRDQLAKMNGNQAVLLRNSDVGSTDIRKLNNAGEKFITESGVYKLVFKSRKPNAERFTDWVADEVLPDIRKHGAHITPSKIDELLANPDLIIELATALKAERQKSADLANEVQTLKIALNDSLEWWTVAKFNGTYNIGWSMEACQHVGRRLTAYCLARAIKLQEVQTNDERFKRVNSYPAMVWHDFMAREGAWLIFPNKRGKQKQKQG